jgi:hypothetical protein
MSAYAIWPTKGQWSVRSSEIHPFWPFVVGPRPADSTLAGVWAKCRRLVVLMILFAVLMVLTFVLRVIELL